MSRRLTSTTCNSSIAVLVSILGTCLVCELFLHLFAPKALQDYPYFFGFRGTPPYFKKVRDSHGCFQYVTSPHCELASDTFAVEKSARTFRIFVLGGSTTYGEPWGPRGAFAFWLEDRLNFFSENTRFEVINCGHKGYGSFRIKIIFDEIMQYAPDLVIAYTGVNEIRDLTFHRKEIAIENRPALRTIKSFADHSYIFRLLFSVFVKGKTTSYGAQKVHKILSHKPSDLSIYDEMFGYAAQIHRLMSLPAPPRSVADAPLTTDDSQTELFKQLLSPWHPSVSGNYRRNLAAMAEKCQQQRVPVILLTRARNFYGNVEFMKLFEKTDSANEVIREVARTYNIPVVSSMDAIVRAMGPKVGFNAFTDEVHPSLKCNQILAQALFDTIVDRAIVKLDLKCDEAGRERYAAPELMMESCLKPNSNVLALLGWQKLFENFEKLDDALVREELNKIAATALKLNSKQVEAYFLLGTLARARGDTALAGSVWMALSREYPRLR